MSKDLTATVNAPAIKVAFLAPRFHTNMVPFLRALKVSGFDVRLFVAGQKGNEDHADIAVHEIYPASFQPFRRRMRRAENDIATYSTYFLPDIRKLYRALADFRPDFIVCRGLTPLYIMLSLPYALFFSKLVLYTQGARTRNWSIKLWLKNTALLWFCRGRWYTPVESLGHVLSDPWTDARIRYLPFCINENLGASRPYFADGVINFLVVGKYEKRKNHRLVLQAIADISYTNYRLTFVGEVSCSAHQSYFNDLVADAEKLGIGKNIDFRTNLHHAEMSEIYQKHDLLLFMAHSESASISQLEAMSYGLGVVISPDNGTASYVKDNYNGMLCNPELEDLKSKLRFIYENPTLIPLWGNRSIEIVHDFHAPEIVVDQFRKIIGIR